MSSITEEIWKDFGIKLKRFIQNRISDETVAEDILQEVFIKIHSNIGNLKSETKLKSWIYQITRNTIIDYYRTKKIEIEFRDEIKLEDNYEEKYLDELSECISVLVNRLPEKYRNAIELTEYKGYTQESMGHLLGLSPSGAKSRVQRAREKLKTMLMECCRSVLEGKDVDLGNPNECC